MLCLGTTAQAQLLSSVCVAQQGQLDTNPILKIIQICMSKTIFVSSN